MTADLLCSDCFRDRGLAFEARKIGRRSEDECPHCNSLTGAKLTEEAVVELAERFFVHGSYLRTDYGGATVLRFGKGEVAFPGWLELDVRLLKDKCGIAFRHHGPRAWRIGEVIPLEYLRNEATRQGAAEEVVQRFPKRTFLADETFYRLRKGIINGDESKPSQYDAPPNGERPTSGRLDGAGLSSILYGSQDVEICIHECRVTVADVCHLATLRVAQPLELLDLSEQISDDVKRLLRAYGLRSIIFFLLRTIATK